MTWNVDRAEFVIVIAGFYDEFRGEKLSDVTILRENQLKFFKDLSAFLNSHAILTEIVLLHHLLVSHVDGDRVNG